MTVEMKPLPNELIDALLAGYKSPEDLIGQNRLLKQLTKALVERALQAELTDHLGHGKNQLVANEAGNTRNGRSQKTLKGDFGELTLPLDCVSHNRTHALACLASHSLSNCIGLT
jgi:putative transposase